MANRAGIVLSDCVRAPSLVRGLILIESVNVVFARDNHVHDLGGRGVRVEDVNVFLEVLLLPLHGPRRLPVLPQGSDLNRPTMLRRLMIRYDFEYAGGGNGCVFLHVLRAVTVKLAVALEQVVGQEAAEGTHCAADLQLLVNIHSPESFAFYSFGLAVRFPLVLETALHDVEVVFPTLAVPVSRQRWKRVEMEWALPLLSILARNIPLVQVSHAQTRP